MWGQPPNATWHNRAVQIAGLLLLTLLSFAQAATFKPDPPHKCDDCETWNKPREPFKLYGNTYYVGTDGLSSILITGDAGHILLDGGLEQSAPLIDDWSRSRRAPSSRWTSASSWWRIEAVER